jgi:hypothetical protein
MLMSAVPAAAGVTWKDPPLDVTLHDVGFVRDGFREVTVYGAVPPVMTTT